MSARSRLRRALTILALVAVAAVAAGCDDENLIAVNNTSSTQLRIFVKVPGGGIDSVYPSPGESSSVVVPESGTFYAFGTVDSDWISTITTKRDALNALLANSDSVRNLSQDEVAQMLTTVNDLNREINHVQDHPWDQVGGCTGVTDKTGDATITITDNPAGGFPAYILVC